MRKLLYNEWVSARDDIKVLSTQGGGGTQLCVNDLLLSMVKMKNTVLDTFYHNKI